MNGSILEVCIDSVESALQAVKGGANRLEMCANLVIGGTTPSTALFEIVRSLCPVAVNVLVRPRYGDFLYTDYEFEIMCKDIETFTALGADGIVAGCLLPDGSLDVERMKIIKRLAGDAQVTLHRAFDVCRDPYAALEEAAGAGVSAILTSGQQNTCMEGRKLIRELVRQAAGRLEILVGGGVNARVIGELIRATGAASFHMSGKRVLDSRMNYRKRNVNMGITGLSEHEIFRTDGEEIRSARAVMKELLCL